MIYFDNNATTRLHPEVLEAMLPFLRDQYGNASSTQHRLGRDAYQAMTRAREQIADTFGATPDEIIFTSGATESINLAIKGVAARYKDKGNHIITCKTEHKAVLATCASLEKEGFRITYLPVNEKGRMDIQLVNNAITDKTILVCIMLANNETGVIHPISDIAKICEDREVLLFCDATQYIGKEGFVDLQQIPIDLLCISAHKIHGPKGIGALYIRKKRKRIQLAAQIIGGQQENGLRGGTYNVPNIVGFGEAIKHAKYYPKAVVRKLRDHLESTLYNKIEDVYINGDQTNRLSNTSNLLIKHVRSNELMSRLQQIAIASGSACVTGTHDPSHVLKSMGLADDDAFCSVRISLSMFTTQDDIDLSTKQLISTISSIRESSPIWQMHQAGLLP